ncbi:cysteine ABC transporter substrate-binding protein [Malaciobacter marinus]|jgi:polar amino acid transport system substrate-binding protein|uniref:cysteine ABC transporter substrate-binding protein n=1 Tax=Malaciobacter marinus TaxID=505249 RepID=UPI0009A8CDDB|nr:cysteine ABC transporter substrate-binding protein [Malaciobacter marinus]SKB47639.1 amino acid ABC transporter substrate-binding protein, PAAT family [Malaciobacter marinus]
MRKILNNFKKLAIAVTLLPALVFGASSSIENIKEKGKVRIGVFSDKAPFGYLDSNGKLQGFDVVIAKRLTKELLGDEKKVEFVLLEPANRVEYLETNKVDIVMANFTVTAERKEKVDFANPYMKVALGVVSPEGKVIKSVADLKDKKLIVTKGTTAETYFTKNYPEINLLSFDHISEAFAALKDGRGAALSNDNTLLFAWARQNKGFVTGIDSLGDLDTIAPAVKKGNNELLKSINQILVKLGKENFIHKAYNKTLKPIYGDSINIDSVVIEGGKL